MLLKDVIAEMEPHTVLTAYVQRSKHAYAASGEAEAFTEEELLSLPVDWIYRGAEGLLVILDTRRNYDGN